MKIFVTILFLTVSHFCFSQNFDGCFALSNAKPSEQYNLVNSTGNPQLDAAILIDVNALRNFFIVQPSFYYYVEDDNSPNAFADPVAESDTFPSGTVCFGISMIQKEFNLSRGGTTIPIIIAHEFGHILDFQNNVTSQPGVVRELFADFQAGCYLYHRHLIIPTDVYATIVDFFSMGDYADFNDPNHHGQPQDRVKALVAGYNWLQSVTISNPPGTYISPYMAIVAAKQYLGIY
jgi:hypothetical protein